MIKTTPKKNLSQFLAKVLFLFMALAGLSQTSQGHNLNLSLNLKEDTLKFSYPKDTIDLGTVTEGEAVEFAFTIRNNYDTTVRINQIHPSCGCTTTDTKGFTLNAGESKEISLTFHSEGRIGSNTRTVHLFTEKGLLGVTFYVIVRGKE